MNNFPTYQHYHGEKKIALLDNSAIAYMHYLARHDYKPETILSDYDLLLIPGWVFIEIKDSEYRLQYLNTLIEFGFPIYVIFENQYSSLIKYQEIYLYEIVKSVVSSLPIFLRYLRQNVETDDLLDLPSSEIWLNQMYLEWPLSQQATSSGRLVKKNAGEISLVILATIFSFFYQEIMVLTIFTQDADCFYFHQHSKNEFQKKHKFQNQIPITYKSNDFILYQLYSNKQVSLNEINDLRKDERVVTYTQEQPDKSVVLIKKVLSNNDFIEVIQNESTQIIF